MTPTLLAAFESMTRSRLHVAQASDIDIARLDGVTVGFVLVGLIGYLYDF
jgi:hypothetical protein